MWTKATHIQYSKWKYRTASSLNGSNAIHIWSREHVYPKITLLSCVTKKPSSCLFNPSSPSGRSWVDTTPLTGGMLASDPLLAAISWAKMLLLPDVAGFLYGAKRKLRWLIFLTPFSSHPLYTSHWNKEIKENCLISNGHNPSPQKKQGTVRVQVLKSDRLGLDFRLFYLLDIWCWTMHLSFGKMGMLLTSLLWGLNKVLNMVPLEQQNCLSLLSFPICRRFTRKFTWLYRKYHLRLPVYLSVLWAMEYRGECDTTGHRQIHSHWTCISFLRNRGQRSDDMETSPGWSLC